MLEVGFAESPHSSLSYTYIEPLWKGTERETPPTNDKTIAVIDGQFTIAVSFLAQAPRGVLVGTTRPKSVSTSYMYV